VRSVAQQRRADVATKEPARRIVLATVIIAIPLLALFMIPNTVVDLGFMPDDDVLRHVAKVISGKPWDEILVLRSDVSLDPAPGWHALLGLVREMTASDARGLFRFSAVFAFVLFCATPLFILRRPEAWLLALLTMQILPGTEIYLFERLLRGRPYVILMVVILLWGLLWPRLKDKESYARTAAILAAAIALSTYLHGSWYIYAVPVFCLLAAREYRAGVVFAISATIGISIGASLTGQPVAFLTQTFRHFLLAFGTHTAQGQLVTEFQAGTPSIFAIGAICLMLLWRRQRGSQNRPILRDPVFMMILLCLVMGSFTRRIWFDLGRPALCVWFALEFQEYLESIMERMDIRRILLTMASAATLLVLVTSDFDSRWSSRQPAMILSPEDKELMPWLPEEGGIFYTDKMSLFYDTFYTFPEAKWRYILGFEPGMMPPEDLAVFREIQLNRSVGTFLPWVEKMRPQDRLVIGDASASVRHITGLEWHDYGQGVWMGRLPREAGE
jgi:hypothetical protein